MAESFKKLITFPGNKTQSTPVSKWRSKSGITLYFIDREGPVITANMILATEAYTNDGLPHCLEHLVYMGSQKYPYKGFVDKVAYRLLSSGLNASTDTDHTCFTLSTITMQGLLTLIPIILDHLFFPLLKETDYITEVYHVNGEGEDGGVLYAEMQHREHTFDAIIQRQCYQYIYPGQCGYRFNMGALLDNLRNTTTLEAVRSYHREYYRPENLTFVIEGEVDKKDTLAVISQFETILMSTVSDRAPFVRPWQSDIPPLLQSTDETVEYASDSEQFGHVYVAWRGPRAVNQYEIQCLNVLTDYLSDSSSNAPLHRKFVDDKLLCGTVFFTFTENEVSCLKCHFENVPVGALNEIQPELEAELRRLVRGEVMDMLRMHRIIVRQKLEVACAMDLDNDQTITNMCIGDALFGKTNEDFLKRMNQLKTRRAMMTEQAEFWLNMIDTWFVKGHKVVIKGKPSVKLKEANGRAERQRVEDRWRTLGVAGLKVLADRLQAAIEDHERSSVIPECVISAIPVPNINDIKFHYLQSSTNSDARQSGKFDNFPFTPIECYFQIDDMHTDTVQVSALMNTSALSPRLRFYLPLLTQLLFELPLQFENQVLPYEEVASDLHNDTIWCLATLGIDGELFVCGKHPQLFVLMINIEREKYEIGVQWLNDLLHHTVFVPERIKVGIERMKGKIECHILQALPLMKVIMTDLLFTPECNMYQASIYRQKTFLGQLMRRLETAPEHVISDLETIRRELLRKENFHIHIAADLSMLYTQRPACEPWQKFFEHKDCDGHKSTKPMLPTWKYIRPLQQLKHRHYIMGVGAYQSSCISQCTRCISDFNHSDHAALKVFIRYLKQSEGPLWCGLRGHGVAYGYSLDINPEHGLLTLEIHPSSDIVKAFRIAHDIIKDICSGARGINELDLENAVVKVMYHMVDEERSKQGAAKQSMMSHYRKLSPTHTREMLKMVAGVTLENLRRIGLKYFRPLFDIHHCRSVICCHTSKVAYVKDEFRKMGYRYTEVDNTPNCFVSIV